ncbi:BON domain-containing protein [Epilithonimonas vandammei]|uniref:BON domain-containing protein n=1 Tax=Epilithonimonas vandammei TaxID=2487072 RepID=A0A3G8ZG29_9FLAO|nr:BON domain-containing protein [Epilithonimonas vandammei]AZI56178.1 BON domain-containing protein [Epilithonimonas vandammei]
MKKTFKIAALALMVSMTAVSCKKKVSDAELTSQATTAITAYPGTSVEVKEGQAHLSGTFATEADKQAAIDALKKIQGVKDVHDMATVTPASTAAPVEVNVVDAAVLQKVNDALKDIPGVKAEDINGTLTLTGSTTAANARKVKESVDALKIGKYDNKITVK